MSVQPMIFPISHLPLLILLYSLGLAFSTCCSMAKVFTVFFLAGH